MKHTLNMLALATAFMYSPNTGKGGGTKTGGTATAPVVTPTPTPEPEPVATVTEKTTAKQAKNSLKYAATKIEDAISVTVSGETYALKGHTINVLIDAESGKGYLSFDKCSEMVTLVKSDDGNTANPMLDDADCTELMATLRPAAEKNAGTKAIATLPTDVQNLIEQLKGQVPAGMKLVFGPEGPKLVKARAKGKPEPATAPANS